jgi:hypothetical protein
MSTNVLVPPSNGGGLPGDRVIRGTVARWSATTGWVDRDGLPLPNTMLVIGYTTVLRRRKDKKPEYITEHPLPDPKQLNAAIPVEEWEMQTRPHLDPIEWRTPGGGGPKLAPQSPTPQLTGPATAPTPAPTPAPAPTAPAPTAAPTPAPAPATPQASTILDNTKPVKPVTVAELIADEIPWK